MNLKVGMHISLILLTLTFMTVATSCQGPAGPDGTNAFVEDSIAPKVELVFPTAGEIVFDTLFMQAIVTDDHEVDRVVFQVSNYEFTALLTDTGIGQYDYSLDLQNWPAGSSYPVRVQAWDNFRNTAVSPVITVQFNKTP